VPSVTVDRIDALRRHIADAVTQTSPASSTLPAREQDRILEQACGEACELLGDWLTSQQAEGSAAADDVPMRELLRDQEHFTDFLSPLFADALDRGRPNPSADRAATVRAAHDEVARAVRAASATARRYPRMGSRQIFRVAIQNVGKLRAEVCDIAAQLRDARLSDAGKDAARKDDARRDARGGARNRRAVRVLTAVGGFLLTLSVSLTVSVPGPQQVSQNLSAWTHAVQVVIAHDLAARAQPGVTIAPPHAGPQLR
jgi:hypothetical protein